jgi:hypothetical protein
MNIFRRRQQPACDDRIEPSPASTAPQDPERAALTAAMATDRVRSMRWHIAGNILLACGLLAFVAAVALR